MGSSGISGGMQMGRDRNQGTDLYTYFGQDSQTSPLRDMGFSVTDWLNQLRAQNNALYGGNGYAGSYGKAPAKPSTYGGGSALPPAGGGQGLYGGGPKAVQGGGNMANARAAGLGGPNPYNPDQDAAGPQGEGGYGQDAVINGAHGGWAYDDSDAYFPRDPQFQNDGDNMTPSPVKPQGNNSDPWSSPLGDAQGAPTGGLVGGYQDLQNESPYEATLGASWLDQFKNPGNAYDDSAANTFGFLGSGDLTGNEGETRGLVRGMAAGTEGGPLADLASGARNANEQETREGYRKQAAGAADATDFELADRGLYGDFLSGLGGADGSGFSGFGGGGAGGGSFSMGPAGGIGAGSAFGGAKAAYEAMVNGGGYSNAEKAALQQESLGAQRGIFDNAQSEMLRKRAMTGQVGNLYGALARSSADRASALGSTARQNQLAIANEAERRKEAGAGGLGNLAGIESSAAQADASRALQAQSLASQNARDAAQMRLQGIAGLNAWDQSARDRQKFGLTGMNSEDEAARAQQLSALGLQDKQRTNALGIMNDQDARASGRMGTGAAGLAGMGQNLYGRKNAALEGATGYATNKRKNQMAGLAGQQQLYGQGQQNFLAGLGQLFDIFRLPQEKYHKGADTSGSGGVSI